MKKCMIMPDSYKHTMSSIEVCDIIAQKVRIFYPTCEILQIPVADGGEGTVDCFLHALGAERIDLTVQGPYGEPQLVYYAKSGNTAVIEMAQAAGLPLVEGRKNPSLTTTYGVGEMIRHAIENGCRSIVIGLGGSCTNDAATGAAAALGVKFFDHIGNQFIPTGATLNEIEKIDTAPLNDLLADCTITAMCDIDNPMFGPEGAAYVFAPQKGADSMMVKFLDENLRHLASVIQRELGLDVGQLPAAGAAGAMGAGVVAFLGGHLKSGIQTVLDLINFEAVSEGADLIITGEGKIDGQSLRGKVVVGIAERAKKKGIPVIAVVGDIGDDAELAYDMGVSAIFSTNRLAVPFSEARKSCREDLAAVMDALMRFQRLFDHACE